MKEFSDDAGSCPAAPVRAVTGSPLGPLTLIASGGALTGLYLNGRPSASTGRCSPDSNAICVPSGDQLGALPMPLTLRPLPSAPTIVMGPIAVELGPR